MISPSVSPAAQGRPQPYLRRHQLFLEVLGRRSRELAEAVSSSLVALEAWSPPKGQHLCQGGRTHQAAHPQEEGVAACPADFTQLGPPSPKQREDSALPLFWSACLLLGGREAPGTCTLPAATVLSPSLRTRPPGSQPAGCSLPRRLPGANRCPRVPYCTAPRQDRSEPQVQTWLAGVGTLSRLRASHACLCCPWEELTCTVRASPVLGTVHKASRVLSDECRQRWP